MNVYINGRETPVNSDDELIEIISNKYLELKGFDDKAQLKHALNQLGIWEGEDIEPMQIIDMRTSDILSTYQFYKNSPEKAFSPVTEIWFECYNILSRLEPRMF